MSLKLAFFSAVFLKKKICVCCDVPMSANYLPRHWFFFLSWVDIGDVVVNSSGFFFFFFETALFTVEYLPFSGAGNSTVFLFLLIASHRVKHTSNPVGTAF